MASEHDPQKTDPALLARNSSIKSYTTSRATYPELRVFYRRHQQADRLPTSPAPLPLLVFIHGLGGSVAQFNSLLTSLTPIATCLAVDLPGCGVSRFAPHSWDAYSSDALVELLEKVIEDHRDVEAGQGVVLIGHSMGTSLAAMLANPRESKTRLSKHVVGLVGICPVANPPTEAQTRIFRILLHIPDFIFDLWRAWDRRGGTESVSVRRFVGADADAESKKLQHMYNCQSRSPVWRRMAWGSLPTYVKGVPQGGIATASTWAGLDIPVFLVGGHDDAVTPQANVEKIVAALQGKKVPSDTDGTDGEGLPDSAAPVDTGKVVSGTHVPQTIEDLTEDDFVKVKKPLIRGDEPTEDPTTPNEQPANIPAQPTHPKKTVQSVLLPSPANHGLLYQTATAPVLAGLVSDFLGTHVTGRLSLGWQLQYLCQDGKWDVKNLEKWQKVVTVSEPIGGVFRAMKTLREVDEVHCPREFVAKWGSAIKDVVDISHDNPVYDPQGLEKGGVRYHKYPTVSKVPPSDAEIRGFVDLVDRIRSEQKERAVRNAWPAEQQPLIGVHCHYGFNRTGFLIACYLVERCGMTASEAIDTFARARPNGIKHAHFKDRLHVRYSGVDGAGEGRK